MSGSIARRMRIWAAALVAITAPATMQAYADTIYVNGGCGDDTWSGTDPTCVGPEGPKATIQAAIGVASNDDLISVAPGTYPELIDFLGKAITLRSSDGPELTIIDGDGNGPVVSCINNETMLTVLDGFTITGGQAVWGGGMLNYPGSPTVTNCIFRLNEATNGSGGGMANLRTFGGVSSNPIVTSCSFEVNAAVTGGGMSNVQSSPTVIDCSFSNNSSVSGAGMYNLNGSPAVVNCSFSDNAASGGNGGGMQIVGLGSPTVTNCIFIRNTVAGLGAGGGMINSSGADATVANCTFSQNTADSGGGAIWAAAGTFANCIVWGNSSTNGADEIDGAPTAVTYSDVRGGFAGDGNIDANPLFGTACNSAYGLSSGSPCIDAGDNTAVPAGVPTDLCGNPRFVDNPAAANTGVPGGAGGPAIVDMGAYELPCDPCDMNCDGDINALDIEPFIGLLFEGDEPCDSCTGDTNGDGNIDAADIEGFINCLFP